MRLHELEERNLDAIDAQRELKAKQVPIPKNKPSSTVISTKNLKNLQKTGIPAGSGPQGMQDHMSSTYNPRARKSIVSKSY
tara:strand:+ start:437 stop:679 length:243 start_codon:yes stop_codon:yes gene_type:complete